MIRAVNANVVRGLTSKRNFSTVPPKIPPGKKNNDAYIIGGVVLTAALLYASYKLESDPRIAADWKDSTVASMLRPFRVLFKNDESDHKK